MFHSVSHHHRDLLFPEMFGLFGLLAGFGVTVGHLHPVSNQPKRIRFCKVGPSG